MPTTAQLEGCLSVKDGLKMRDEDSTQQNEDDIPADEDLDFDIISGRNGRTKKGNTTDNDNEPDEGLASLQDRVVSTISVDSITTDSNTVSGTTLPSQLGTAVERVSSVDEVVTVDTHSVVQQAELDTVSRSKQGGSDADEEVLPDHIQTTGTSLATDILHHKVTNSSKPRKETAHHVDSLGTTQLESLTTDNRSTSHTMTLNQSQTSNQPEQEIEEYDPAYQWSGGNPYGSTTPQCIIHIDNNNTESLAFLQRVLRDTYTELEGGRPRTKTATVRVGSIENTTIHGAIVTLDLTTEGWTVSTEDQQIRINHDGQDMIPELRSTVSTLYGGKLGYFVINVDLDDIQSRFISDEKQELVRALLPATENYDSTATSDELLQRTAAPIRLAVPRSETESEFIQIVKRYFSLKNLNQSRIADIEAEHETRLSTSDWRRIALTQQQESSDAESDEHYLWKAAMTAGIAWEMYEEYSVLEEEISFDKFVETQLISSGPIQSESSDEPTDTIPDIELTTSKVWAWNGLRHYLSETNTEPPKDSQVVLEFETGRAEGAFNFRKFYHSLNKYSEKSNVWIYLVIPPRILFRSESRANMINQLITRWESSAQSGQHAELCIPVLGKYGCDRLISAESLITEWFGVTDE